VARKYDLKLDLFFGSEIQYVHARIHGHNITRYRVAGNDVRAVQFLFEEVGDADPSRTS
jgi:hypothetical protein